MRQQAPLEGASIGVEVHLQDAILPVHFDGLVLVLVAVEGRSHTLEMSHAHGLIALYFASSSKIATARVQPAEAAWIFTGKQAIRKP